MSENLFINVQGNAENLRNSLRNIGSDLGNLNRTSARTFGGMSRGFKGLNQIIGLGVVYKLGNQLAYAMKSAMDMVETVNLFNVALGDMSVEANKTVTAMSTLYGLDATNLQSAIGGYALLARSMGMTSTQAEVLATNTAKLAVDLSSLTNVPVQQVMQDLKSGLVGQSETVYKYGMDVTEAGLNTEAMNQGITTSVRNMTQGEKMALRYSAMIRQSGLAQGDFARTINSPANQLKILTERVTTLGRSIGTIFIPLIGAVLPWLNALASMLITCANAIATFFGYEPPKVANTINNAVGGISTDVGGISDGLNTATGSAKDTTKALKEMKNATMGIDELNILPAPTPADTGSGGSGGGGGGGLGSGGLGDFKLPSYDNMMSGIKSISGDIQKEMQKVWDSFVKLSEPLIFANWQNLSMAVATLGDSLKLLGGTIGAGLVAFYRDALVPLGVWLIEKGVPELVFTLAMMFLQLDRVLQSLSPSGQYFITGFLQPLGNAIGGDIITGLKSIQTGFSEIGDWFTANGITVNSILATLLFNLGKLSANIGGGLLWFLQNVLVPVGVWFATNILPSAIGIISSAFGMLNDIIAVISPSASKLFDDVLRPFGVWLGAGILASMDLLKSAFQGIGDWFTNNGTTVKGTLDKINESLSTFGKWATDNYDGIKNMAFIIAEFFGVWKMAELLAFIEKSGGLITIMANVTKGIKAMTTAKIIDKGETFALAGAYIKDLVLSLVSTTAKMMENIKYFGLLTAVKIVDKLESLKLVGVYLKDLVVSLAKGTVEVAKQLVQWALLSGAKILDAIKTGIVSVATGVLSGAEALLNLVMNANPIAIVVTLMAGLVGALVTAYKTSATFKASVDTMWTGIKSGFSTGVKAVLDFFTSMWKGASDTVAKIKSFFSGLKITFPKISLPSMPKMRLNGSFSLLPPKVPTLEWYAKGGVFDSASVIGVGENGKEAVMPLENNTGWIDILASKLNSSGTSTPTGSDTPVEVILQVGATELGRVVINSINKLTKQEGKLSLNI